MIRPTTADDAERLVELAAATGMFKRIEIQALGEVFADYFAADRDQAGHRCVTCDEDGQLLGFTYYAPAAMTDRAWYLYWIAIRKDVQARGIGTRLLRHLEDDIRSRRGRVIFVETGSVPHYHLTRKFYLKNGYEQHALLKDFYAAGDSMVVFRKEM